MNPVETATGFIGALIVLIVGVGVIIAIAYPTIADPIGAAARIVLALLIGGGLLYLFIRYVIMGRN